MLHFCGDGVEPLGFDEDLDIVLREDFAWIDYRNELVDQLKVFK
jgi:hypothetical protein